MEELSERRENEIYWYINKIYLVFFYTKSDKHSYRKTFFHLMESNKCVYSYVYYLCNISCRYQKEMEKHICIEKEQPKLSNFLNILTRILKLNFVVHTTVLLKNKSVRTLWRYQYFV